MQIRQRLVEELLPLIEEVEQSPDAKKWEPVIADMDKVSLE
jgi:hypothetical protein